MGWNNNKYRTVMWLIAAWNRLGTQAHFEFTAEPKVTF